MLRSSRQKTVLAIFGAVAFVAIGLFMAIGPISESSRYPPEIVRGTGWLCIAFFGGTGLLSVNTLARPKEVHLSPEGFRVKGLRRTPLVPWSHVRRFFIAEIKRSKFVCYELNRSPAMLERALVLGRTGAWGDGQIPAHLETHPDQVLELLEDWRRRYAPEQHIPAQ